MGVSENGGFSPQIIHLFIGFSLFSPSILGENPYFWKHPYDPFCWTHFQPGVRLDSSSLPAAVHGECQVASCCRGAWPRACSVECWWSTKVTSTNMAMEMSFRFQQVVLVDQKELKTFVVFQCPFSLMTYGRIFWILDTWHAYFFIRPMLGSILTRYNRFFIL